MENEKRFITDNIYEVAWLKCKGIDYFQKLNKPNGYKEFVFENATKCKKILHRYWNGQKEEFEPKEFVNSIVEIKRQIRQGDR